jgi:hypothetical protein
VAGEWFSPGTTVSSTNKTDRHNITEILLKVVLNTIILTHLQHLIEHVVYMFIANVLWRLLLIHLRIDCNFCSVHEEITSIGLYTPCNPTQGCVQPDWGYFEWTEQIISINPYKLIQTFFVMTLKNIFIFFKIRQIIENKFK